MCNIREEDVKMTDFILCHFYTIAMVLAKLIEKISFE